MPVAEWGREFSDHRCRWGRVTQWLLSREEELKIFFFFFFLARDRIWREVEEALVKELLKSWPMSVKSIYILGCQDTCLTSEHVLSSLQGHGYGTSFSMTGERQIVKKNKSCHPENHRLVSFTLIHRKIMGQVQLWVCEDGVAAWA